MNYFRNIINIAWFGIKNNRALAGIMILGCVVILPGFTFINGVGDVEHIVRDYGICISYFAGVVIPMVLFSYVQRRRECDFYNSMPVKRSQYFWGYFISGFVMFFVPFTLMTAFHIFAGHGNPFKYYLPAIGMFMVIYCSMITAVMFSGSVLSTIVTFILRNTAAVALVMLPVIIAGADLGCYMSRFGEEICILTPAAAVYSVGYDEYTVLLWQLLIAVFELIIGFLLHRYRKSESTTALAFPKIRYVYQYLVTLIFVLLVDALILGLLSVGYGYQVDKTEGFLQSLSPENIGLTVLFTLAAAFICFILLNMILDRSGSAAFKKFRHFFIFLAGYVGILAALYFMVLNYIPPYILPYEPEAAVILATEYREATEEEKAIINKGEWYTQEEEDKVDYSYLNYVYGKSENEIYIEKGRECYLVYDEKKLKTLVKGAEWGKTGALLFEERHYITYFDISEGENPVVADVEFIGSIPKDFRIEDINDLKEIDFRVRYHSRQLCTDNYDELLKLTDKTLINPYAK